jgi:hypothetical protein
MHWTPQGERVEDPALDELDYAEQHESGQLRLGVAGEQRELVPLSDETIPTTDPLCSCSVFVWPPKCRKHA